MKINLFSLIMVLLLAGIIALSLSSCKSHPAANDNSDISEGKTLVGQFYFNVKSQNDNAIDQMASDTLKKLIGKNGLSKITVYVNKKLGNFKNYSILDGQTSRSEVTLYKYKIQAVYDRTKVIEYIGLLKKSSDGPKVISYDVYSDLLK